MSTNRQGRLNLNNRDYVVVSTEEFSSIDAERLKRCFALPPIEELWVGYLIRQHRNRMGLTQAELASRTDTKQKHIDKIESGEIKQPKDALLVKLAGVFGSDFVEGLRLLNLEI